MGSAAARTTAPGTNEPRPSQALPPRGAPTQGSADSDGETSCNAGGAVGGADAESKGAMGAESVSHDRGKSWKPERLSDNDVNAGLQTIGNRL